MTAEFKSFPTDASRALMNAVRQRLARAIADLADAVEDLEATMLPAQRLGQLGHDLAAVERELAELTAPHEIALGDWIAGGQQGERPQPSLGISTLERQRALLAADVAAVDRVRPQAEEAHQRVAARVRECQAERDQAVAAAAVDAAQHYVRAVWINQLQAVLASQAVLVGLAAELRRRGSDGAATAIHELVGQTRSSITTPLNPTPGLELLNLLVSDARALLEPTQ